MPQPTLSPETMKVTPITRTQEAILLSDGSRRIRCFGAHNPHYYADSQGVLKPIDLAHTDERTTGVGLSHIHSRNIVSLGIRADGQADKYLGLRPDVAAATGDEQLEFSLLAVEFEGVAQKADLSTRRPISSAAIDLGSVVLISTRQATRQCVKVERPVTSFRISFRIHCKGLVPEHKTALDEYWFYNAKGELRFRITRPLLIDPVTLWPLLNDDGEPYDLVTHELTPEGDGTYLYTKTARESFTPLFPGPFLVDASTVYATTADGKVQKSGSDWATVRGAASGGTPDTSSAALVNALRCSDSGGLIWVGRSFLYFDTSAISGTISAAVLNLYGYDTAQSTVCAQKGTQADTLEAADFDSFTGDEYGHTSGWSTTGYNSITFNSQGRSDINTTGTTKICIREYAHDYANSAPGASTSYNCGMYYADQTGTDKDPYLEITTGYIEDRTVTAGSIVSVTDRQTFVEALQTTISAVTTADDAKAFMETLQTVISSMSTVSDKAALVETLQTVAAGVAAVTDGQIYRDTLTALVSGAVSVTARQAFVDAVQATITGIPSITDHRVLVEQIQTVISSVVTASDKAALVEAVTASLQAVPSAVDAQHMVADLEIMTLSHASIAEIMGYVERITVTARSEISLDEVFSEFSYIYGDEVRQRLFASHVRERTFETEVWRQ